MIKKLRAGKRPEWAAFLLFAALYCVITAFHEPWYDEAQAWQIAKCASVPKILFEMPHYEGHPPLWHLILAIPAKLGVPFELGLKSVGFLISAASAALLLFRSRLPRPIRLVTPFTYFFFYQYGIVVRPYCMTLLFLLLLGMELPERRQHPWRIFALLLLLCLTCAYGIVIAGGIALCVTWEIFMEKGVRTAFREIFRDPRSLSLCALLIAALLIVAEIRPYPDTLAAHLSDKNPFLLCLICVIFIFPTEAFLTSSSWFTYDRLLLQTANIPIVELILLCAAGTVIWFLLICFASKKNLKFLLIPYLCFSVFASIVYVTSHHLGMSFLIILFWVELTARDENRFEIGRIAVDKIAQNAHDRKILKQAYTLFCAACLAIPIVWSATASVNDVFLEYSYGRSAAAFIKEHDLENLRILSDWTTSGSATLPGADRLSAEELKQYDDYINTNLMGAGLLISAYFPNNIFLNLNFGHDDEAFIYHRLIDYEQSRINSAKWRAAGTPDLLIGLPYLDKLYGDALSYDDYSLIHVIRPDFLWKMSKDKSKVPIFMRSDLAEQYGFETRDFTVRKEWSMDVHITDEMREAYRNGMTVEEIMELYEDDMSSQGE